MNRKKIITAPIFAAGLILSLCGMGSKPAAGTHQCGYPVIIEQYVCKPVGNAGPETCHMQEIKTTGYGSPASTRPQAYQSALNSCKKTGGADCGKITCWVN